jgi:hypothetical protein
MVQHISFNGQRFPIVEMIQEDERRIQVTVQTQTVEEEEALRALLSERRISVMAPDDDKEYRAVLKQTGYRFHSNTSTREFELSIIETLVTPPFAIAEVNGIEFSVLAHRDPEIPNISPAWHLLVKATSAGVSHLREALKAKTISVKRVGIDEEPVSYRLRGRGSWSEHEDETGRFFKHEIILLPTDYTPPMFGKVQSPFVYNTHVAARELLVRFEALLGALVENGTISQETSNRILLTPWDQLLPTERTEDTRWRFFGSDDAEAAYIDHEGD